VDINSDHTIIVSGSVDQTAIVWRYNETSGGYDSSQTLTDVQSYIPIVQISGNGSVIVVGGGLQDVYVYLLSGDQYVPFQTLPNAGPVQAVAIDANSGAIAYSAVGDAGPTQLYAFNPENRQYELRQSLTSEVYSADWSSTGANLFLGHGKVLEIYVYSDADDSYKLLSKLDDALDNILSVDVSGAGDEWLASASVDGNVYIYRLVGG
jgi:WD40 repeat protein